MSSLPEIFYRKCVLKNFSKFTRGSDLKVFCQKYVLNLHPTEWGPIGLHAYVVMHNIDILLIAAIMLYDFVFHHL